MNVGGPRMAGQFVRSGSAGWSNEYTFFIEGKNKLCYFMRPSHSRCKEMLNMELAGA
jgi:hypothetical protein